MKKRFIIIGVKNSFLSVRTRALLQVIAYSLVKQHGSLANSALVKLILEKYAEMFGSSLPVRSVNEFILAEKQNKSGILAGPVGRPSSMTKLREENVDRELLSLVEKFNGELETSNLEVFELLGIN